MERMVHYLHMSHSFSPAFPVLHSLPNSSILLLKVYHRCYCYLRGCSDLTSKWDFSPSGFKITIQNWTELGSRLYLSLVWQPWTLVGLQFLGCKSGVIDTLLGCYKKYIFDKSYYAFAQYLTCRKPVKNLALFYYVLNKYVLIKWIDYNPLFFPSFIGV